jgi:hypothetical protein
MWQPGPYIRSCELSSVIEGAHSNVARKTKGWLEHEIRHAAETREAQLQFRRRAVTRVLGKKFCQFRQYFDLAWSGRSSSVGPIGP